MTIGGSKWRRHYKGNKLRIVFKKIYAARSWPLFLFICLWSQSNPSSLHTEFWLRGELTINLANICNYFRSVISMNTRHAWGPTVCKSRDTPTSILFFRQLMWNIAALTWLRSLAGCKNWKLLFPRFNGWIIESICISV